MSRLTTGIAAVGAAGVAGLAWSSLVERNLFGLRSAEVPCLAPGSSPIRLLHVSDPHLLLRQQRKQDFIASLAALHPDLVIHTGDTLAGPDGAEAAMRCFAPLLDFPGAFCFGSNDYYGPIPKNPAKYLKKSHKRYLGEELPWEPMRDLFVEHGWADMTNARATVTLGDGRTVDVKGVDDPHLKLERLDLVEGRFAEADLKLGLVHAPEPKVLDVFEADGAQLLLSGHTHGGQLRLPFVGAIVTNCGIDRARAMGVSRYGRAWLHVSPGLGTSPYAPVRFWCPPRATLLTLVAQPVGGAP